MTELEYSLFLVYVNTFHSDITKYSQIYRQYFLTFSDSMSVFPPITDQIWENLQISRKAVVTLVTTLPCLSKLMELYQECLLGLGSLVARAVVMVTLVIVEGSLFSSVFISQLRRTLAHSVFLSIGKNSDFSVTTGIIISQTETRFADNFTR